MNAFRTQKRLGGATYPIILNTCNFPTGSPCLLTLEEVRTLFHEFGHGLHGLLSNVTYRSLAGTAVKRDFVELPSQIMEHWAVEPQVLRRYAKHIETGEVIPDELIDKILGDTSIKLRRKRISAASYLDLAGTNATGAPDAAELESKAMDKLGLPSIAPRYRSS